MSEQCPVEITNNIIKGKWKPLIILKLGSRTYNFNELQKKLGNITPRSLSLSLKELEKDGIIQRVVIYEQTPIRVAYSLTTIGHSLVLIVREMYKWGEIYSDQ